MEDGLGEGKMGNGGVKSGIDVFLCSKKKKKRKVGLDMGWVYQYEK